MAQVILTPSTLLQLATGASSATRTRISSIAPTQVQISAVAVAIARASARKDFPQLVHTNRWHNAIHDLVMATLQRSGHKLLYPDERVIAQWENIRDHVFGAKGETADNDTLGQDMRLVIATAMVGRFVWIERHEEYHDGLRAVGLDVESL